MPNLKDLKVRINSVKSTQKITSAMKMVAAAKLRRAQESAEAARPYAEGMERMVASVGESVGGIEGAPRMLVGTGKTDTHLIVACTADRGLCGGFNGAIIREVRTMAHNLKRDGKTVKLLCVGRKGRDGLKRQFEADIIDTIEGIGRHGVEYAEGCGVAERITALFEDEEFDVCTIVFNRFQSAMTQVPTAQRLIPFSAPEGEDGAGAEDKAAAETVPQAIYIFEPEEQEILAELLPKNIAQQGGQFALSLGALLSLPPLWRRAKQVS